MLSDSLKALGFTPSEADRNVWLKPGVKEDGFRYYQMILVYVDDILHLSHEPGVVMDALRRSYELKKGSVGPPTRYLGANVERIQLGDGRETWAMSSRDYIESAISNVESMRKLDGEPPLKIYGDCKRPYPKDYRPEIDVSDELDPKGTHRYQELIGILRWAVELGRVDIMTEVSCLSQHLCAPHVGHLDAAYMIFRFLQRNMKKNTGRIAFDPVIPPCIEGAIGPDDVVMDHWKEFYPEARDELPPNMPEPLGNPVVIATYVDANHAGNLANRRSHTGILIYVNNSLIHWYSKRQNTVESSSFGSEFVALRIATELVSALIYKLRMFGVPVEGPATIYCDNKSVVTNASVPTSVLNKRHNAICYHRVRESQAAGIVSVLWIEGKHNLADLLTKTTLASIVKHDIADCIFSNNAAVIEDGA
jgi:Reverse transcriptase (RNA-dependent DNA polymerase).